jgi:putative ABC transport system substrate-binding protein
VFTSVSDPIGTGFVESFSRPGGMITGFTNFEASMGSKWLELIHDLAPSLNRAAMLFNPTTANTAPVLTLRNTRSEQRYPQVLAPMR